MNAPEAKGPPFEMKQTWLQCMVCGTKADLLKERQFTCPSCGGLFDVNHDFRDFSDSDFLQRLFSSRVARIPFATSHADQSGVWPYHELIMPFLPRDEIVSLAEGNVPILPAGEHLSKWLGTKNVRLILEGRGPTGSFKDFGGTVLISVAKAAGVQAIACASTGDTSAMAAAYAAAAGLKCVVILPRGKVTPVQLAQPLVHGAKVITLPGSFDDCMRVQLDLVKHHGVYPANSLNPARIEGHQATVFRLAHVSGWKLPDWIALPVGNGSNCSSVGKGMRVLRLLRLVGQTSRILGCQSRAANPLARSWMGLPNPRDWKRNYKPIQVGETAATAARIGNPVSADKVMREISLSSGAMATASESDLNEAVAVCGLDGIFVCPQTGIALAGLRDAIRDKRIGPDQQVAVVSTADGLKFTDSAAVNLQSQILEAPDCKTKTVADIMQLN